MLPDTQSKTWTAFFDSTVNNDILDPRTTVMIQLAAAFAIGCYP